MSSRIDIDDVLERAFAAVRDDEPSAAQTKAATQRVEAALRDEANAPRSAGPVADYAALVPDYLADRLPAAQRQLFEAELRSSASLRQSVADGSRPQRPHVQRAPSPQRRGLRAGSGLRTWRRPWAWAAAAALATVAILLALPRLAIDQTKLAQLTATDGALYHVAEAGIRPLAAGAWIDGGQRLRTAKDATAVLTLLDGSEVEVGRRSQLSLSRQRSGSRIQVDRGRIIVQAAPQGAGSLHVATDELLVAVRGTIFGVSHGTQGSRVAVVEGEVEVRAGRTQTRLKAGGQFASRNAADSSLESAVGWSRHAGRYIAALREYAHLKRHGAGLLATTARHSTRLLDLSPSGTFAYLAVPNAPAAMANAVETLRRLRARLGADAPAQPIASLETALPCLREVGEHLGAETVLTLGVAGAERAAALLSLAEIRPGAAAPLRDALIDCATTLAPDELSIVLVDAPAEAQPNQLSIWLREDLLAASTSPAVLAELETHLAGTANPFASGELRARLAEFYATGASYLGGIDFRVGELHAAGAGIESAVAEWQTTAERSSLAAVLQLTEGTNEAPFRLDRPAPIGALDFFSAEADLAAAAVVDVDALLTATLGEFAAAEELRAVGGLDFMDDLAAALGGEFAIGIDGPLLPTPSWLAIAEVYDDAGLNQALRTLAQRINEVAALRGDDTSASWSRDDGGRYPVHRLAIARDGGGDWSMRYAILNGYLVAAPSLELIERARQTYQSGADLTTTAEFRELLPAQADLGFSAVAYVRYADGLLAVLPTDGLDDRQREAIDKLRELVGPVFAGVYAEPDHVQLALNAAGAVTPMELAILASAGLLGDGVPSPQHGGEDGA